MLHSVKRTTAANFFKSFFDLNTVLRLPVLNDSIEERFDVIRGVDNVVAKLPK